MSNRRYIRRQIHPDEDNPAPGPFRSGESNPVSRPFRRGETNSAPGYPTNQSNTSDRWDNNSRRGRMLKFIIGIVVGIAVIAVIIMLVAWLVIVPYNNLGNVQQIGNGQIMLIQATRISDALPEYKTTINYTDNSGQLQDSSHHLLRSDILYVTVNIYQFLWLPTKYQLGDVTSYASELTPKQNDAVNPLNRSIPLQGEGNGYFNSGLQSPLIQVTTLDCAIPLSQATASPYNLTIQMSSDGKWTCGK